MLQNLKELYGDKLAATDGEIGHVKDFYFDDRTWVVRYLVADTGSWLSRRQILLSPHAFGPWDRDRHILPIHLTRKQIEASPPIEAHRPVSRQDEQDYYRHYGWPAYWEGGGMWGIAGFPVIDASPTGNERLSHRQDHRDDPHLRSSRAVVGYEIQATDGVVGVVRSFMVDDKSWAIGELVAETGHWYSGKEILIRSCDVAAISYEQSTVIVKLAKAEIEQTHHHGVVHIPPEL